MKTKDGEVLAEWLNEQTILFMDSSFLDGHKKPAQPQPESAVQVETGLVVTSAISSFKCDTCGMSFKRKDHLKSHIIVQHLSEKPSLQCPLCSSKFGYKANLKQHMKRKHSAEMPSTSFDRIDQIPSSSLKRTSEDHQKVSKKRKMDPDHHHHKKQSGANDVANNAAVNVNEIDQGNGNLTGIVLLKWSEIWPFSQKQHLDFPKQKMNIESAIVKEMSNTGQTDNHQMDNDKKGAELEKLANVGKKIIEVEKQWLEELDAMAKTFANLIVSIGCAELKKFISTDGLITTFNKQQNKKFSDVLIGISRTMINSFCRNEAKIKAMKASVFVSHATNKTHILAYLSNFTVSNSTFITNNNYYN